MTSRSLASAALLVLVTLAGCGTRIQDSLCCTDFKVGADLQNVDFGVDASIKGQFAAFAQAAGDLAAVATSTIDDVASACKAIATAGGANADKEATNDAMEPPARVDAWCALAKARIDGELKAAGTLTVVVDAPRCEASVTAAASCQANCTVDADCKAKMQASPPTCDCTGAQPGSCAAEVSCSGTCSASAGATIDCEGSCDASCSGSCTAQASAVVDCNGKCEGTCAAGGSANGPGIQADGTCNGTCSGTCTMSGGATVKCSGTCKGGCTGSCKAQGSVAAKCSGTCDVKAPTISCKGGSLKASVDCNVDAKCQSNCDASARATAECTPPRVDVAFAGSLDANAAAILDALRANLPNIFLAFTTRGQTFVDLVVQVAANATTTFDPGSLGTKGVACVAAIGPAVLQASENMKAAVSAAGTITASTGGG